MEENINSLNELFEINLSQLSQLTDLIRGNLDTVKRRILVSLITVDVHGRDIVDQLREDQVDTLEDFIWQKQLRYYFVESDAAKIKPVIVK